MVKSSCVLTEDGIQGEAEGRTLYERMRGAVVGDIQKEPSVRLPRPTSSVSCTHHNNLKK